MNTPPVDPTLIMQDAAQKDLVRRKLDMDALRKRLGDNTTQQEKLRESCEGFESIFLQKMWEQMRKNVSKEGYLHSKDEETYQSLFDVELCKKMASAGGIGLGEMLYQQLSQKLEDTGRTTTPGAYRQHMPMQPSGELMGPVASGTAPGAASKTMPGAAAKDAPDPLHASALPLGAAGKMTPENLYSALPEEAPDNEAEAEDEPLASAPGTLTASSTVDSALQEIRTDLARVPADAPGVAVAAPVVQRDAVQHAQSTPERTVAGSPAASMPQAAAASPPAHDANVSAAKTAVSPALQGRPGTAAVPAEQNAPHTVARFSVPQANTAPVVPRGVLVNAKPGAGLEALQNAQQAAGAESVSLAPASRQASGLKASSWQGNGPVSATPKPVTKMFGRNKNAEQAAKRAAKQAETVDSTAQRGMAPQETVWPYEGVIASKFGWEEDPATGRRRWNSGVEIAAPPSTPVRAVLDGTVVFSGHRDGMGHTVVLEHADGFRSYYSNLQDSSLRVGDKIKHGSDFAKVAVQNPSSGKEENSAFLHFELKRGEMALNPESAIRRMTTASR